MNFPIISNQMVIMALVLKQMNVKSYGNHILMLNKMFLLLIQYVYQYSTFNTIVFMSKVDNY